MKKKKKSFHHVKRYKSTIILTNTNFKYRRFIKRYFMQLLSGQVFFPGTSDMDLS